MVKTLSLKLCQEDRNKQFKLRPIQTKMAMEYYTQKILLIYSVTAILSFHDYIIFVL